MYTTNKLLFKPTLLEIFEKLVLKEKWQALELYCFVSVLVYKLVSIRDFLSAKKWQNMIFSLTAKNSEVQT